MTLPVPNPVFHWTSESWGHALRCRPIDACTQQLFTSRQLGLPSPERWQDALTSVGATPDRLMRVKQVHGNVVRVLRRGAVTAAEAGQRPDGDAIVSNEPGLVLAVMVADCVPILIVDPVAGAAAAIHAGWRGTAAQIARVAVDTMTREFGTRPSDLMAAIGPSAGPDDYEVGESLVAAFLEAGHSHADVDRWFIRTGAKPHLDLWASNRDQLVRAGMDPAKIHVCGLSTISNPDVFDSYRVAGDLAGRMAGLIVVPSPK